MFSGPRTVFYISDGTGISAQTLGHSLLSQFEGIEFRTISVPFVDDLLKAEACLEQIRAQTIMGKHRPIVLSTLVEGDIAEVIAQADALHVDLFRGFLTPLEAELGLKSTHYVGRSHAAVDTPDYHRRMEAVNYTLNHDDGLTNRNLDLAEVILVGVSRSGKTPTSVYLAMHYGLFSANYPLIPEDFERGALPGGLEQHREKLIGLSIEPARLHQIRNERRPDSVYASLENCEYEIDSSQRLMRRYGIEWLDSTTKSVEELSAAIVQLRGLKPTMF